MPLEIYRNRTVAVSLTVVLLSAFGLYGSLLSTPLFFQGTLHMSAAGSGRVLAPIVVGLVIGSVLSGQLVARTGGYCRNGDPRRGTAVSAPALAGRRRRLGRGDRDAISDAPLLAVLLAASILAPAAVAQDRNGAVVFFLETGSPAIGPGVLFGPGNGAGVPGRLGAPEFKGGEVSEPKQVTRAELEGRLWELLNNHDNSTHGRLDAARLIHESIKAREEAQQARGEWDQ